jgi:hypothetical protein
MKNLLEILKNDPADFTLSEFNMPRYNAMDHPDHMTGRTATEKAQCIYSVYKVDIKNDLAYTQNINAWGRYITETHPLSHLIKHS